ncbi:hypothetical protein [Roseofilum casamattae]|uniref:Uncharacterized protein n=1 Tax=Roseofilum casamattae BLCC-M143 TaxID=3022442 RepID=A0ABT7C169_9CYAN|nr:hypothetical protein [Roseofilum casamattae]MDJ1185205.1 hypothetical protein [Roseofilum casamattae BLCC-M143]
MNERKQQLVQILERLVDRHYCENPQAIAQKIISMSQGQPEIARAIVDVLLSEPGNDSKILLALEGLEPFLRSQASAPAQLKDGANFKRLGLSLRTALSSVAMVWIGMGIFHRDTLPLPGAIVVSGVIVLVLSFVQSGISREQQLYQIAIATLPNLGWLIFSPNPVSVTTLLILTLVNFSLAAMLMFVFDRISAQFDRE